MSASASVQRIDACSGTAFHLKKGQTLRVIDPMGSQVADLLVYDAHDLGQWLSNGRTFDYEETIYLTTGHRLWSNRSEVMLTITRDDVGVHDFLLTPCSTETYTKLYKPEDSPRWGGNLAHHPNCFDNLVKHLGPHGVTPAMIPTTFNVFMDVKVTPEGKVVLKPPGTKGGECIEFRAEMDLLVGLTACSAEKTNGNELTPIDYAILD